MSTAITTRPTPTVVERLARLPRWATAMTVVAIGLVALTATAHLNGAPQLTNASTGQTALRLAIPILLAGLGGLWAERAGVVNIGLEGMMVLGTWGAAWGAWQFGPWAGLLCAALFGAAGGLVHALATVTFGVNHIVSGVAINILGPWVAKYLASEVFLPITGNPRESPAVEKFDTYSAWLLPSGLEKVADTGWFLVSDLAGIVRGLIIGVSPLTMLALLLVPLTAVALWRTGVGLNLRSCGENPEAAASVGVPVKRYQYAAVIISGVFAGLGGAALVLNPGQPGYLEGQTNGRGYIGLAAMIFGNWNPLGVLGGAALFGYSDGVQLSAGSWAVLALVYAVAILLLLFGILALVRRRYLTGGLSLAAAAAACAGYWFLEEIPSEFTPYLPHIVTLIVLASASQSLKAPAAVGKAESI